MTAVDFPESNVTYGPPSGFTETQVGHIRAFRGEAVGGSLDLAPIIVTAWLPDAAELAALNEGKPIFLSFVGILPPHMATTDFGLASHPS